MRSQALSLAAAFLFFGLGVITGATRADELRAGHEAAVRRLEGQFDRLQQDLRRLRARVAEEDRLVAALASLAAAGRLAGVPVRVVALAPDPASVAAAREAAAALAGAGAAPVDAFALPRGLLAGAGGGDQGVAVTSLATGQVSGGLASLGRWGPPGGTGWRPAAVVLVRAGGEPPAPSALAAWVAALRQAGLRVVAFEPGDPSGSLRSRWRQLAVPSVAGLQGPAAAAALVWVVAGSDGQFGTGPGADRLLPEPPAVTRGVGPR